LATLSGARFGAFLCLFPPENASKYFTPIMCIITNSMHCLF
jgi:hypothetical protein